MSLVQFSNNAATTLGSAISSTATTITVAAGTGAIFPTLSTGQYFTATMFTAGSSTEIPNEIVYVTARSGDTMTVLRGQEGTTAQVWNVGDNFANFPTAGFLSGLAGSNDIQSQTGNSAVDIGSTNSCVAVLTPPPASLAAIQGSPIRILKSASANTSSCTLNLNGFGAKNITLNGAALQAGQLAASAYFEVLWDGTSFELISAPALIYNQNLAPMSANTFKANTTGSPATPSDVSISSLLPLLGFGAHSLSSPGYYIFPNGLIIQWGTTGYRASEGDVTVSYPIAFPNAVLNAIATMVTNVPGDINNDIWAKISPSTNNSTISVNYGASSGGNPGYGAYWVAIGY